MSQPGNAYLVGPEALDVSRMTGIPLSARQPHRWQVPDTHPGAVDQGVIGAGEVYIDLERLSHADAGRVFWARVAGWEWLRTEAVDDEGKVITRSTWRNPDDTAAIDIRSLARSTSRRRQPQLRLV